MCHRGLRFRPGGWVTTLALGGSDSLDTHLGATLQVLSRESQVVHAHAHGARGLLVVTLSPGV